jgi:endonuclease/exonuclease/phosphatase family metal-dependent hydrolase
MSVLPWVVAAMIFVGSWLLLDLQPAAAQGTKNKTLTFCFWNVENFFDDKRNPKAKELLGVDEEFDEWFSTDKVALETKLERLCQVLLHKDLNDGKGPDILALAEVESERAVELLKDALNKRIKNKADHYTTLVYRDPKGGRTIATAFLSRVPVVEGKTRILGNRLRILKATFVENKHELNIIASHWTSRVSDAADKGEARSRYARLIYDDFERDFLKNPNVAYLVCGDFNDEPTDDSVRNDLGAFMDVNRVLALKKGEKPMFFHPFGDLVKAGKGTHYFRGKPLLFDHIVVSPAMLNPEGWQLVPKSVKIVEQLALRRGGPDRFGGKADGRPWKDRGAADHFPVTVQLRVSVPK